MGIIWPTSRGWVIGLAAFAWLAVAVVNRMIFPFLLACAACSLTLASLVSALLSLREIRLRRGPIGDATTGQCASLPVILENRAGRRRQPLIILESMPFAPHALQQTVVPPLRAREERVVTRQVLAMKRGEHALGRITLRSGDPAGLFYRQRRFRCPAKVVVYPAVEPIPDLLLHQRETIPATTGNPVSSSGMSQDFYGVREYNPSDGLRFIHWKSSARYGQLMVREFERNAVMSVAVLLDAHEHFLSGDDNWSNLEYQIRAAASICSYCSSLYCTFALAAGGDRHILLPPAFAAETKPDVMYTLATLKPGRIAAVDLAFELGKTLPRNSAVFVLSLSTPPMLREALEILRQQDMDVRWYCARREAFAGKRAKERSDPSAQKSGDSDLFAAELRPGMNLDRALEHGKL